MAERRPTVVEPLTERAQASLRLAVQHFYAAYRLARADSWGARPRFLAASKIGIDSRRLHG